MMINIKIQFYKFKIDRIREKIDHLEEQYNENTNSLYEYIQKIDEDWVKPLKDHLKSKKDEIKNGENVVEKLKYDPDIKPILKELSLQLHPDKNREKDTTNEFQNFMMAMQIGDYDKIIVLIIENNLKVPDERIFVKKLKEQYLKLKEQKKILRETFLNQWPNMKSHSEKCEFIRNLGFE